MPRDHFPFFAQEIVKVLDAADVTFELESLRGLLTSSSDCISMPRSSVGVDSSEQIVLVTGYRKPGT